MRKITLLVSLMLGALSFAGCQNETATDDGGAKQELNLTITSAGAEVTSDDATRTIMEGDKTSGFRTAWAPTDKLGVYSYHPEVGANMLVRNYDFTISSIENGVATFGGSVNYSTLYSIYDIYTYYPRNSANDHFNSTYESVPFTLEETQQMPANDTYDASNDLMVSKPTQMNTTEMSGAKLSLGELEFSYLVGFMNLSIKDITVEGISSDDVVESVTITAEGATTPVVTGKFNLDLAQGTMAQTAGSSNAVTVNTPAGVTLGELSAWAVVAPFEAETLTFLITTETHTIEKSVELADFAVRAAGVKTFNMTIDDRCNIFRLGDPEPMQLFDAESRGYVVGTSTPEKGSILLRFYNYDPNGADKNGMYFDINLLTGPMDMASTVEILDMPNGTYPFNTSNTAGTVYNQSYITYGMVIENGYTMAQEFFSDGTMTISGDHTDYAINLDITLANGRRLVGDYNGPLNVLNPDYVIPEIDFGTMSYIARMDYYPDPYGEGVYDGWLMSAADNADVWNMNQDGWILHTQFQTPMNSGAYMPDYEYVLNMSMAPYTALAGYEVPGLRGTHLRRYEGGYDAGIYLLVSGTLTSSYSNGTYTIEVDAMADNGSVIVGKIEGIAPPSAAASGMLFAIPANK